MLKLEEKRVNRLDILAFKDYIANVEVQREEVRKSNKKKKVSKRLPLPQIPIDYLMENVFIMRLLGWTVTMGRKISREHINGFQDVIKYSDTVGPKQAILYKGRNK